MTEVSLPLVLLSGIVSVALFVFLIFKSKDKRAKLLAGFCIMLSIYSLAYYFMRNSGDESVALFLDKISIMGAIFAVAIFMNFTVVYTSQKKNFIVEFWYFLSIITSLMTIGNQVISEVSLNPFYETLEMGYYLFTLQVIATFVICIYYFFQYMQTASQSEQNRTHYLLFFFSIISIAAALDMLRQAGILMIVDVLLLQYAIFIFMVGVTYTILKYKLLEIRVIMHKSAKYTLIAMIVIFIFELIKMILDEMFSNVLSISYSSKISLLLMTFLFEPIKNKTEKFCDRIFLKR